MFKTAIKSIVILVVIGVFTSCTKVVDVTVPNAGERLVVEASILWEKGTSGTNQTIKLSTSSEYFSNNSNEPVTAAAVTITNSTTGEVFSFVHQNNGEYSTNSFNPVLNDTYDLEIVYEGRTYNASETLVSVVEIVNIEQEVVSSFGGDEEIRLKVYFDDPVNIANYYLGVFKASNIAIPDFETLKDEFTDGNQNFMEYQDDNLQKGTNVILSFQGISQRYYNYLDLLIEQLGEGGPFQTTPARLKGNCFNVSDPGEEVLGYFRLSETVNTEYEIN
ncbi:conserved protein of unknown function [Tenacibaculum sp. 190130A14a]|uniref:DUF4249 domain-containing protein n=1 Tax=Tenacibaculum polynesiense TaxID=3137857 RepID=A0ABM9P731_9FLAO